ncbi:MAG TPA: AI-2E family transporter [Thermoanaerobaculia bacterium]|nr:AI-2E family transporter [Thermoanaerobaculia bacterium]
MDGARDSEGATAIADDQAEESRSEPSSRLRALSSPTDVRSIALTGLFVIAAFLTLRFARELFLPIVLSILLKFLLDPVIRLLQRIHVPVPVAAFVVLVATAAGLALIVLRTYEPAQAWFGELPSTLRRAESKLIQLREAEAQVAEVARQVDELAGSGEVEKPSAAVEEATPSESFFAGMRSMAATAGVTVALLYFLLASGDLFLRKLVHVLPRLRDRKRAVAIARQIESDVSTYLVTITLINIGLGAAVAGAMHALGMPTPLLWGAMATCFNFVPYLGAAVGVAALAIASVVEFDGMVRILLPPIAYLVLSSLEGSLITPLILGRRLALNPVAVFLALFFWGWMWGIAGALLAVPLMVAIKIFCDRVPPLSPIGEFLGR